jgi:hypothetical protein
LLLEASLNESLRNLCSSDFRTASVLLSPVKDATSSTSRSTSGFLMFSGILIPPLSSDGHTFLYSTAIRSGAAWNASSV